MIAAKSEWLAINYISIHIYHNISQLWSFGYTDRIVESLENSWDVTRFRPLSTTFRMLFPMEIHGKSAVFHGSSARPWATASRGTWAAMASSFHPCRGSWCRRLIVWDHVTDLLLMNMCNINMYIYIYLYIYIYTLWLFNMAVKNDPFIDNFQMKPPFRVDVPWLC